MTTTATLSVMQLVNRGSMSSSEMELLGWVKPDVVAGNYVALAFERFWQVTVQQRVIFETFAEALAYVRASLHGAVLDTLRAYSRPREVPLPSPGEQGEPQMEAQSDSSDVLDFLGTMLSNNRERRLAYLLYHCGLKPREIVRFCPQEWSDVQEIYLLRRNILERVLRNADQLRWQLNQQEGENDGLFCSVFRYERRREEGV